MTYNPFEGQPEPPDRAEKRLRETLASMLFNALYDEPIDYMGEEGYRVVDVWLQDSGRLVVTVQRGGELTRSVTL